MYNVAHTLLFLRCRFGPEALLGLSAWVGVAKGWLTAINRYILAEYNFGNLANGLHCIYSFHVKGGAVGVCVCVCDVTDLMGICEEDNTDEEGSPCGDTIA